MVKVPATTAMMMLLASLGLAHADLRTVQVLECRIERAIALSWDKGDPTMTEHRVDDVETIVLDHRNMRAHREGQTLELDLTYTEGQGLAISGPNFAMLIADDPEGATYRVVITGARADVRCQGGSGWRYHGRDLQESKVTSAGLL